MSLGAAAALGGLGSLVGAGLQSSAAQGAAQTQANAAMYSANLQLNESQAANNLIQSIYGQNTSRLSPFVGAGATGLGGYSAGAQSLSALTGLSNPGSFGVTPGGASSGGSALTTPFSPTMAQLAQTPGYQFALDQGKLAVSSASSAAGQGGAVNSRGQQGPSGPLGKALVNYAEGAASQTFQQQWGNYMTNNAQIYNMLSGALGGGGGLSGLGESAAAQTGTFGTTAGGQGASALLQGASGAGSYITGGSAAQAAGQVGSANALAGGLQGATSSLLLPFLLSSATAQGTSSGTSGGLFG